MMTNVNSAKHVSNINNDINNIMINVNCYKRQRFQTSALPNDSG